MSHLKRIFAVSAILLQAVALAGIVDSLKTNEVLIHRDNWGVPHIYGKSSEAVAFGFGYAQAEDHLETMLRMILGARGDLSRVEGEKLLPSDVTSRTFLVPEIVDQTWDRVPQSSKNFYRAFADGINRYIETHPQEKLPWYWKLTARDVAIYTKWVILRNSWWIVGSKMTGQPGDLSIGSNAWAVAGSRSASGKAMLLGNPHLPWTGSFQWYEAHLKCPDFDVAGVTFFGVPFPSLGHNGNIAFSATDNKADTADAYLEKIDPNNPDRYQDSDGQWKAMEKRTFRIEVRKAGGNIETVTRTARYTRRGPYLALGKDPSYSVALAGWKDMPDALTGAIRRLSAHNLSEFKTAMSEYPMDKWHITYADRDGNIFLVGNGYFPRRDPKYNWDRPVPGWEEAAQWKGIIPFQEVPQFANPPGGVIVQCNQSVFASAEPSPINPRDYPPWIARGALINQRDSRAARAFSLLASPKVTWEEHKRTAFDPSALAAGPFLRLLLAALEGQTDADLTAIQKILKDWDRMTTLDNRAVPILSHWIRIAMQKHLDLRQVSSNTPESRAMALSLLKETASQMHQLYGKVDVPMRQVQVLERGGKEFPVTGCGGGPGAYNPFGGLFSTGTTAYRNGKFYATKGSSWMLLISFETPLKVFTLMPMGESENPSSPHHTDQAALYSKGEPKPLPFTDDEVIKLSEKHYKLTLP